MLNNPILIQTRTNSLNSRNHDNPSMTIPLVVHLNCLFSIHMANIYLLPNQNNGANMKWDHMAYGLKWEKDSHDNVNWCSIRACVTHSSRSVEHSRWQAFLRGHRVNRAAPGAEEGWNLMSDPFKCSYSTVAPVSVSYSFLCRRGIVWVDLEEQQSEIHKRL